MMEEKMSRNKAFDAVAWGAFILLLGAGWLVSAYYQTSTSIYIALGAGVILIALNFARWATGIQISKFSLFIGAIVLALSGSGVVGYAMPFFPTLIVLVGLFVAAEAIQKLLNTKKVQVNKA